MAELTKQEQENVRVAIRVLNVRHGGLALLASRMEMSFQHVEKVLYGIKPPGALMAIRVAQMAGASVEDVLTGRFPGRAACRHCGHPIDDANTDEGGPDVH